MNRCPITYEECGTARYSRKGLRKLSPKLADLEDFPYSAEEQRKEAFLRMRKMSIQGVQPKLSVKISSSKGLFEITDQGGKYIIKPQHAVFPELPENEDLTMRMASCVDIEVPLHGMVYSKDGSLSYFVKRFDRMGRGKKQAVEDFAQLSGKNRETKYDFSVEKLVPVLNVCTFPAVVMAMLYRRLIFCFLTGNEDMHLKNFSLITRDGKVELAPAYDFLNTTIAYLAAGKDKKDIEETALPLKGRKKRLTYSIWIDYLGLERMGLQKGFVNSVLASFAGALPKWRSMIEMSFLTESGKRAYLILLNERASTLEL